MDLYVCTVLYSHFAWKTSFDVCVVLECLAHFCYLLSVYSDRMDLTEEAYLYFVFLYICIVVFFVYLYCIQTYLILLKKRIMQHFYHNLKPLQSFAVCRLAGQRCGDFPHFTDYIFVLYLYNICTIHCSVFLLNFPQFYIFLILYLRLLQCNCIFFSFVFLLILQFICRGHARPSIH